MKRGASLIEVVVVLGLSAFLLLAVSQISAGYWRAFHSAGNADTYRGTSLAWQIANEAEQALSWDLPADGSSGSVLVFTMIDPLDPTRLDPTTAVEPWDPFGATITRRYELVGGELIRTSGGVAESLGSLDGFSVDRADPRLTVLVGVKPQVEVTTCRAVAFRRQP